MYIKYGFFALDEGKRIALVFENMIKMIDGSVKSIMCLVYRALVINFFFDQTDRPICEFIWAAQQFLVNKFIDSPNGLIAKIETFFRKVIFQKWRKLLK